MYIKDKHILQKISQLLKTKHIIEILKLSDGTNTLSEISKKLKIPLSNLSKYVKELKNANMVYITKNKRIDKSYKHLRIDLDNII
jgi:DNA-binding transcriptional regulator GbsR (MarR family)